MSWATVIIKRLVEDDEWSETWQPTPQVLEWFRHFLRNMREGAMWAVPGSQHVYRISHADKTFTLLQGDPNDPKNWHKKSKRTLAQLGYRMIDGTEGEPENGEMAFAEGAEKFVSLLLDDIASPFTKQRVTLQYRPIQLADQWKWYWILLPEDKSKALATGQGDSRAAASTAARLKARELKVVIANVEVLGKKNYAATTR